MTEYRIIRRGGMYVVQMKSGVSGEWEGRSYAGNPHEMLSAARGRMRRLMAEDVSRPFDVIEVGV